MQLLGTMEQQLEAHQQTLDADRQQQFEARRQVLLARTELDDVKASLHALRNAPPQPNVIEHLPTPMARTVFGRELHLRLQGGRLAYVPWDELVERLKQDAPNQAWKLKESPRITETIGPIHGFRMKYTLRQADEVQRYAELDHFVLVPVQDDVGDPLEVALREDSQLQSILSHYDPDRTTVTVWVYPDSYGHFRHLKSELFRRGYAAAGRPLPDGHPIGGSPEGSRSAAQ